LLQHFIGESVIADTSNFFFEGNDLHGCVGEFTLSRLPSGYVRFHDHGDDLPEFEIRPQRLPSGAPG